MKIAEFQVAIRRSPAAPKKLSIRCEIAEGFGVVALTGRPATKPSAIHEIADIELSAIRGSRFIHVLPRDGRRQSYALSRLTTEALEELPAGLLVTLEPHVELGFRYLVLPSELPDAPVQIEPEDEPPDLAPPALVDELSAPAPPPASTPTPAPSVDTRPPRQRPVSPELAEAAVEALTVEEARAALLREMAKVHDLHAALDEAEAALADAEQRERDLMDLLSRWQQRAHGAES